MQTCEALKCHLGSSLGFGCNVFVCIFIYLFFLMWPIRSGRHKHNSSCWFNFIRFPFHRLWQRGVPVLQKAFLSLIVSSGLHSHTQSSPGPRSYLISHMTGNLGAGFLWSLWWTEFFIESPCFISLCRIGPVPSVWFRF